MTLILFGRLDRMYENGYTMQSVKGILYYLTQLISCVDKDENVMKEKRCLGLFLLNSALETAGTKIGDYEELIDVV
jgi:hypothetical protein